MEEKFSLTVDDETYATNPGNVEVNAWVWTRYNFTKVAPLAFGLVFSIFLVLEYSLWFIPFVLIMTGIILYYWIRIEEHFELGDSNGGIVVSLNPPLVAVATDLTKGPGEYPVIKLIPYKPHRKSKVGDRIPTIALYRRGEDDDNLPYWVNFFPIPLDYATSDQKEIEKAMATYPEHQWKQIEDRLAELSRPLKAGIYKSHIALSGWKHAEGNEFGGK